MESLWDTVETHANIANLLNQRQYSAYKPQKWEKTLQFSAALLQRLSLDYALQGHQGCVNCLEWSRDGRILASGSDDTQIRLWSSMRNFCHCCIKTKHVGNIFSVKFVGDGTLLATAAGDCRVMVQPIKDGAVQNPIIDCHCHGQRVKRLACAPDQPQVFFSAGEDGLCLQFDLRESHKCLRGDGNVLVDWSRRRMEMKCIAVNPVRHHLVAIGANDCYVRMYDRRFIKAKESTPKPVDLLAPGHLAPNNGGPHSYRLVATYLTFSPSGRELLLNLGGEQIYLFDLSSLGRRSCRFIRRPPTEGGSTYTQSVPRSMEVKPCCTLELDHERHAQTHHKHNYRLSGDGRPPCICDYLYRARRLRQRDWLGDTYAALRDYHHIIHSSTFHPNQQTSPKLAYAIIEFLQTLKSLKWHKNAAEWLEYLLSDDELDEARVKRDSEEKNEMNEDGRVTMDSSSPSGTFEDDVQISEDRSNFSNENRPIFTLKNFFSHDERDFLVKMKRDLDRKLIEMNVEDDERKKRMLLKNAEGAMDGDDDDDENEDALTGGGAFFGRGAEGEGGGFGWEEDVGGDGGGECCWDYAQRFLGHCNVTTDIKEANFIGEDGDFICAGSDDGMIFIWDKATTNLLSAFNGDVSIVNCVQPHPTQCLIASSGIDPNVKIWSPQRSNLSSDTPRNGHHQPPSSTSVPSPEEMFLLVEANQDRISLSPFETILLNMGFRVRNGGQGGAPGAPQTQHRESGGESVGTCRTS